MFKFCYLFVFSALSIGHANAEVLTWNCHFKDRIDKDGQAEEEMRLTFKVDTVSQESFMEGNIGIKEVGLHIGDNGFSFIESVNSGSVQTTTITRDGWAVHSRHTILRRELVPAQHHGRCEFE